MCTTASKDMHKFTGTILNYHIPRYYVIMVQRQKKNSMKINQIMRLRIALIAKRKFEIHGYVFCRRMST